MEKIFNPFLKAKITKDDLKHMREGQKIFLGHGHPDLESSTEVKEFQSSIHYNLKLDASYETNNDKKKSSK